MLFSLIVGLSVFWFLLCCMGGVAHLIAFGCLCLFTMLLCVWCCLFCDLFCCFGFWACVVCLDCFCLGLLVTLLCSYLLFVLLLVCFRLRVLVF